MNTKFKVGDKVRRIGGSYAEIHNGMEGIVSNLYPETIGLIGFKETYNIDKFELVEEKSSGCEPCSNPRFSVADFSNGDIMYYNPVTGMYSKEKPIEEPINNKQKTIMSKITTFAKNLVLSADEKVLRKYGLKNECGEFTDEAETLVMAKLVKENEAYLVELAKAMELEEKNK